MQLPVTAGILKAARERPMGAYMQAARERPMGAYMQVARERPMGAYMEAAREEPSQHLEAVIKVIALAEQ